MLAFDDLAKKYGKYASWAIWNPACRADTQIITTHHKDLNRSIIMVGLNISKPLSQDWSNFHGGTHDRKLMCVFNNSSYRGAYMTDIIKREVEVNSRKMLLRIKNKECKHIKRFNVEMQRLGAPKHALFVLFGKAVVRLFRKYLADIYPNHIACPHYSRWGSDAAWVNEVRAILEDHHRVTKSEFNTPRFNGNLKAV